MIQRLMLLVAAFLPVVAAQGQGQFLFNTRDTVAGNNVVFTLGGAGVTGPDAFVEVLAGPSMNELTPLTPLLPLNRTGLAAGYTQPFGATYNAPAGSIVLAYRAYIGSSYATAFALTDTIQVTRMLDADNNPVPLVLPTDPTTPPPELFLGTMTITLGCENCPEPATWTLLLLGGLGSLAFLRGGARGAWTRR